MKVAQSCVVCGSADLTKKLGQFFPFIVHKVLDYPICHVSRGNQMMFPPLLTNAIRCRACGFCFSQLRFEVVVEIDEQRRKAVQIFAAPRLANKPVPSPVVQCTHPHDEGAGEDGG
jgi:hypothetical protein